MMHTKRKIKLLMFFVFTLTVLQSNAQDTVSLIRDFNKVLSFAVKPYVYYKLDIKLASVPVLQQEDTLGLTGMFYKNRENIYYTNGREETFIDDSLLVEIDNEHKSIMVSKVDVSSKDKMNIMPLDDRSVQELFRRKFTIIKSAVTGTSDRLSFESKQYIDSASYAITNIVFQYASKEMLPELMDMSVTMKQAIEEEYIAQMKEKGIKTEELVQRTGSASFMVRSQRFTMSFKDFDLTKEKAMQMPGWKEKLSYNPSTETFTGKGAYSDYEITKTF